MAQVLKLKILTGKHSGREIEINRSKFVIGRADDCDLRPASPAVSRRHCAFVASANGFKVQDLGGANGTLVNDVRIQGEHDLASGDRIKVGPLEFQVSFAAAVRAAESGLSSNSDTKTSDTKTSDAKSGTHSQKGTPQSAKSGQPAAVQAVVAAHAGEIPPPNSGGEDDVMQWLTDAPAKGPKSIYIEIDTSQPNPANVDTAQISLDGTQPFVWPGSPAPAPTIVPTPSVSEMLKAAKSGSKLPDPNDAGNTRDAANAAIEMFRHRNDK